MRRTSVAVVLVVAGAFVLGASNASAVVGRTYLTAYDKKKGTQARAGKFGRQIRLRLRASKPAPRPKTKTKRKAPPFARATEAVRFCTRTYFVTKYGKRWIAAHRRANHELVVRRHAAKRKYRALCGKIPRRAKAKPRRRIRRTKPKPKTN